MSRAKLEDEKEDIVRLDIATAVFIISQFFGVFKKELFAFGILMLFTSAGVYLRGSSDLKEYRKDLDRFIRPWTYEDEDEGSSRRK